MSGHATSPKVLIVDDNIPSAKTLKLVLAAEGYAVDCAGTAAEATRLTTETVYDAALIDITLPDGSGIDLLPELKRLFPDLIAIIVTGHASTESSIEALNRGAAGYVQKPVQVQHLLQMLKNGLEKKRLEAENWRMLRRLSLLHAVGATVGVGLDAASTLTETISLVVSLMEIPAGGIWWTVESADQPSLAAEVGMTDELLGCLRARVGNIPSELAANPKLFNEPWLEHEANRVDDDDPWQFRIMSLRGHQGTIGYMALGGPDWPEDRNEEAEVLCAVAGQVGVAMENMRLYADVIDTHERLKEAQDQIVQNEKLSAVGRVVSGVAHELNNPLMAVIGYSELLADGAFGEETPKIAERVFTQAKRCASIVQGLLSFSRQEEIQVERTHINDIVYSAIEACEHARGDDLNLMRDLDAAIPEMAADPGALQQVMVNIINNAYQATNGHGGAVSVTSTLTDERVVVSVQDTGPGMPDDVLGRVFDPFYTTKGVGKGTGLGLSVSHGIIKEHGGELRAANAPEGGAVFTIDIPIVAPPDEAEVEPATTQDAPWLQ